MFLLRENSRYYKQNSIAYNNQKMADLSDEELIQISKLYSSSYGKYNMQSQRKPGEKITLKPEYYKKNYCGEDMYIASAKIDNEIIAHAIYIRKNYESYGIMTWVLQLVVDKSYRKMGIASTLLRSIWGFSDDYAWGLASANPCTVKTLESATFRKCKPKKIKNELKAIRTIGNDIPFIDDESYEVTNSSSQVNSHFFVDNSEYLPEPEFERTLGKLREGHEWLAFTFRSQGIQRDMYMKHYDELVEFSERKLKDAYSRMKIESHGWAKGAENEAGVIADICKDGKILDLGCGQGRHSIALSKMGFEVKGVDFSEAHINYAISKREDSIRDNCEFVCEDIRNLKLNEKYNHAICLYDVIGSFPDESDNIRIIRTANKNIKKGGYFIISVMNMELTERIVPPAQKASLRNNPDVLLKLKPSNTMQESGNIFKSEYLAIDTDTGLVYRKEQFDNKNSLSAEYIIRDKRYTKVEICGLLEKCGFEIEDVRFVNSGHFDSNYDALDTHAKEILVIARKIK